MHEASFTERCNLNSAKKLDLALPTTRDLKWAAPASPVTLELYLTLLTELKDWVSLCENKKSEGLLPPNKASNCHETGCISKQFTINCTKSPVSNVYLPKGLSKWNQPLLNNALPRFFPSLIVVRSQAKYDGCIDITEDFAFLFHAVKNPEFWCNKTSPSFLFPRFPASPRCFFCPAKSNPGLPP